ncbi:MULTISPECIES: DUF3472 domain-containing protein [Empedobacter]|uniref:DUF3472 domain-containing protein n=2 Tax=Empedobacter TaxID=59734 RepID=A0A3R8SS66_9FLAO|nr:MULTISPECIES: DUF3472 domain-containing protein [Empedobacter]MDH0659436.1 DUF3472 domain-containing protein [Empedobacter sp. GD03865]MDH1603294.1 DUF3472 domain-containing protein [Empedobacter sp. GD03739]RRT88733.1 DUF3472 domain-containing protein [Empedobacter falsenii]RRT89605.1 DUF3472 domain-containing protein [Empedobacter falsenii]
MKTIHYILFSLSVLVGGNVIAQQTKTYDIPLVGNAFEVGHKEGSSSTVTKVNALISPQTKNVTKTYFKVLGTGNVNIQLKGEAKNDAQLNVGFNKKTKKYNWKSTDKTISVGTFAISKPGYVSVDLSGLKGEIPITDLIVSGTAVDNGIIYSNDPQYYYWARRGPSCHLAYEIPTEKNVSYYYNEIVVPKDADIIGSYYMANGFGEGYFGIQANSQTERRILFSVWSPFVTDDPKSIPDDEKIVLLKKGDNVKTGEFGNEGSGGQSYMKYNWKADTTYKFLLKGVPNGDNSTTYTAWFFMPETNNWQIIASFKRPKTNTYLKRFHSFLENFMPTQGYLTRKVNFNNQWVYDGEWKKVNGAKLTVDATYKANQRIDATGGTTSTGYFLKMGGFFNEIEQPGTAFKFDNKQTAPQIDFSKLQ